MRKHRLPLGRILLPFFWAVLVVLGTLGLAQADGPAGQVTGVRGSAVLEHDGVRSALAVGAALAAGDTITTEAGTRVKLRFADGSEVRLGENTTLRIDVAKFDADAGTRNILLRLPMGLLRAAAAKLVQSAGSSFEIHTGIGYSAVRGTQWIVEASANETKVYVQEGKVAVGADFATSQFPRLVEADRWVSVSRQSGIGAVQDSPPGQVDDMVYQTEAALAPVAPEYQKANTVPDTTKTVTDTASNVTDAATDAVSDVADAVDSTVEQATSTVSSVTDTVGNVAGKAVNQAASAVSNTTDAVGNAVDQTTSAVSNATDAVGDAVGNTVDQTATAVSSVTDVVGNTVEGAVSTVTDTLSGGKKAPGGSSSGGSSSGGGSSGGGSSGGNASGGGSSGSSGGSSSGSDGGSGSGGSSSGDSGSSDGSDSGSGSGSGSGSSGGSNNSGGVLGGLGRALGGLL